MNKAAVLSDLRQQTGIKELNDKEMWKAPQFSSGIACGIVAELLGNARIEWLLALFKLHPEHYIFWCERQFRANPVAIHQRGITLERIKFITAEGDLQRPLRLALESQLYPFIIAPTTFTEVKIFQRFHLLAEKSKSTLFLLGEEKFSLAWPISLQLKVNHCDQGFDIHVEKVKHGARE